MKNAEALDDDEQQEYASQASTAAPSDRSASEPSDCESPTHPIYRTAPARRAENAAPTTSSHDGTEPRRRKTAAEIHQIFNVPCQPLAKQKKIGAGAFGTVFRSQTPSWGVVAIKEVVEDESYVNREAEVCKMLAAGNHPNIVEVKGIYFTADQQGRTMNLVLEYVPQTMRSVLSFLAKRDMRMKSSRVQIYMYQLARALLFIHQNDILHRDVKPENILLNPETHELKLADFGSAKKVVPGRYNTTYICSRFYRAPELILDRELYGPATDIWAYGCILAELAVGCPFFVGEDNVSQLVEITRVLGSITKADADSMAAGPNNQLSDFHFPPRERKPWSRALTLRLSTGKKVQASFGGIYESLLDGLLQWRPSNRLTGQQILAHPFFGELKAPSGHREALPPQIFEYTDEELAVIRDDMQGTVRAIDTRSRIE